MESKGRNNRNRQRHLASKAVKEKSGSPRSSSAREEFSRALHRNKPKKQKPQQNAEAFATCNRQDRIRSVLLDKVDHDRICFINRNA